MIEIIQPPHLIKQCSTLKTPKREEIYTCLLKGTTNYCSPKIELTLHNTSEDC